MRDDTWIASTEVVEVSGRLALGGMEVPADEVSLSRSVPSNLPSQVAVGGYTASTGSAKVLPSVEVAENTPTPWGSNTPHPGDPASVSVISGGHEVPVFTGAVDSASGMASETSIDLKLVDASDRLNRAVSLPPLSRIMPPPTTDGSATPMHVGLVGSYLVDRVLRQCGFYATPPMGERCVLSVPLTGSTLPERGRITKSRRDSTWVEQPYFSNAWHSPLGSQLYAEYEPELEGRHDSGDLSRPMEIVFSAGNTQKDSCRVETVWGNGAAIAVGLTSAKSITVQFTYPTEPGVRKQVFSATTAQLGSWRHVSMRVEPNGDRTCYITVRTNYGKELRSPRLALPWWTEHQPMQKVTIDLRENVLGGVQILFPAKPSRLESYAPTANLTSAPELSSLWGSPAIIQEPAIDLLAKWSEAECAAFWLDESGVLQWRNRVAFTNGQVVWEGDSTNDLLDLSWSHDVQGAANAAVVEYKDVAIQRSNKSRMKVWEGSGQTMEPGDVMEDIVSPPADEVWIKVDGTPQVLQADWSQKAFNKAYGSWVGFTPYDSDGEPAPGGPDVGYTYDVKFLDSQTWKITQRWDGKVPAGINHIRMQAPGEESLVKPQWQGQNLPLLRAQMRLKMSDVKFTADVGGPSTSPDLSHDAGWWVQTEAQARSLAYWLAQRMASPLPVVDGVDIVPNPRLQLGDKIRVRDTHRTGLLVTGVVTEIKQTIAAGEHSMSLRLLVTNVVATKPTLAEYDQAFTGATLETRDQLWSEATLLQFDSEPLRR